MTKQEFINFYVEQREHTAMIDSLGEMFDTVVAPLQQENARLREQPTKKAHSGEISKMSENDFAEMIVHGNELAVMRAANQLGKSGFTYSYDEPSRAKMLETVKKMYREIISGRYTKDEVILAVRNELIRTNIAMGIGDSKLTGLTAQDMQYIETIHLVLK